MVLITLSSTLVGALLFARHAQSLPSQPNQPPGVISLPLEVRKHSTVNLEKRQKDIGLSYPSQDHLFHLARRLDAAVSFTIGKDNPQTVTLALDTGSEFTWVNPDCAEAWETHDELCIEYGHFDVGQSSSKRRQEFDFRDDIEYGEVLKVNPAFYEDAVSLGNGLDIPKQIFGVAASSSGLHAGIIGLALPNSYADYSIVNSLKKSQIINRAAFSIDFGSHSTEDVADLADASKKFKGSITFGGIDAGKFSGKLVKRPLVNNDEDVGFYIEVDHMSVSTESGSTEIATKPVKILVDSGATMNFMPLQQLKKAFGASVKGRLIDDIYMVKCGIAKREGSVDFTFGNTVISTSFGSLVDNADNKPDKENCLFRIQPGENNEDWSLGLPFFESAYTVFDHDAREMYVAPAAHCQPRLVEMSNDLSGVTGCPV